ncbi:uncharacterized protein odam isoform X2 [Ictalurus furcatus]|uniref:uncharacterized protein odam isoform X2 n=1 Tax=Ictalurus furcatus TaxID=66913 RepID=UPI002350FA9F|nr:uncharacterized protein odam isoform X2 [Ictalurus furcatus]
MEGVSSVSALELLCRTEDFARYSFSVTEGNTLRFYCFINFERVSEAGEGTTRILRQQLGIIASNSNEIVRLPGLTLAGVGLGQTQVQGTQFLSPFLIQSQPDLLMPPHLLNFGPQFPGQFLTPQQNLPPLLLPSLQQEQPTGSIDPNNPPPNNQDPAQVVPQYFPLPRAPAGQGFRYYISYGFPSRNTLPMFPSNQNTANKNVANRNPVGPTKVPQPVQNNGKVVEPWHMTPPPENRGDRPGRGVEGGPALAFFQP